MEYDNYRKVEVVEERGKCEHRFGDVGGGVRRGYSDDLCDKVIEHGRGGFFIEGFCGRYNVCMDEMCSWLSDVEGYSKFCSAVKVSVSASIHYWNEELLHAIEGGDWQGVSAIRGILGEVMRGTPKVLRESLFNNLQGESAEERERHNEELRSAELLSAMTGGGVVL